MKAEIIAMPPNSLHRGTFPIAIDGRKIVHHGIGDVVELPVGLAQALVRDGLARMVIEASTETETSAETETPGEPLSTVMLLAEPWNGPGHYKVQQKTARTSLSTPGALVFPLLNADGPTLIKE